MKLRLYCQFKTRTLFGILVTDKSTRTAKGERMKFVSLEDPTGIFEVTLFPKVYQKFGYVLTDKGPFVVKGRIEKDCGTVTALWLGRMKAVGMQGVNQ
jgi:DNA polymerase III alpha subunit